MSKVLLRQRLKRYDLHKCTTLAKAMNCSRSYANALLINRVRYGILTAMKLA